MSKDKVPVYRVSVTESQLKLLCDRIKGWPDLTEAGVQDLQNKLHRQLALVQAGLRKPDYAKNTPAQGVDLSCLLAGDDHSRHSTEQFAKPIYTQEEQDAQFAAADDFAGTGVQRDWHEFLAR